MAKRIWRKLLFLGIVFMLFAVSVASVAAADTGLTPHYPYQYSVEKGTMWVNWDPNYPGPILIGAQYTPGGSFGPFTWVHWNQSAVNWIKQNIDNQWYGHKKPAIAFHGHPNGPGDCANVAAADWHSSNLPGARRYLRSHCPYYNEEVRIIADDPWSLAATDASGAEVWYYAQVMYIDNWATNGNINISSYFLDWYDSPWSGAPNGGRDYMGKICFNKTGSRQFNLYNC